MKKRYFIILILILVFIMILTSSYCFLTYKMINMNNIDYFENKEVVDNINNIITNQNNYDNKYEAYASGNYHFENPKIIVNPYDIAPLSALVLFNTDKEYKIDVYVNDELLYTKDYQKEFILPLYKLKNGINNIKLVTSDYTTNEFTIETSNTNSTNYMFNDTEAIWSLSNNFTNVIKIKDNFYATDNKGSSLYEINYLGRITKQFITGENFLKIANLDDNTILVNSDENYEIDILDGSITNSSSIINDEIKIDNTMNSFEYKLHNYMRIVTNNNTGNKIKTIALLKNKIENNIEIEILNNMIYLNEYDATTKIILVGKDDYSYVFDYGKSIEVDKGLYAIYIEKDDTIYNTNKVINFDF